MKCKGHNTNEAYWQGHGEAYPARVSITLGLCAGINCVPAHFRDVQRKLTWGVSWKTWWEPNCWWRGTWCHRSQLRNQMVSRCVILCLICCQLGIAWVLEQPASSLLEHHPDFAYLAKRFNIYRVPWYKKTCCIRWWANVEYRIPQAVFISFSLAYRHLDPLSFGPLKSIQGEGGQNVWGAEIWKP